MRQLFFWISKIKLRFCVLAPITVAAVQDWWQLTSTSVNGGCMMWVRSLWQKYFHQCQNNRTWCKYFSGVTFSKPPTSRVLSVSTIVVVFWVLWSLINTRSTCTPLLGTLGVHQELFGRTWNFAGNCIRTWNSMLLMCQLTLSRSLSS